LDLSLDLYGLINVNIKSLILRFPFSTHQGLAMHQVVIICLFDLSNISFNHSFSSLLDKLIDLDLLSFIHPHHGERETYQQDTDEKFREESSVFITIVYIVVNSSGSGRGTGAD